jgi:hypothetical protein
MIRKSKHPILIRSWQQLVAQIAALLHILRTSMPEYSEYSALRDHQLILNAYQNQDLQDLQKQNRMINDRNAEICRLLN